MDEDKNLFDELGLEVGYSNDIKVGEVYPLFGMITEIVSEELGNVVVKLNHSIELTLNIGANDQAEKLEIIKAKAFETGIFVTEIKDIGDPIKGYCHVVIYGRPQIKDVQ